MTQFMGTHRNRLDAKGRVSVPAAFREVLRRSDEPQAVMILRPSHLHPCVEGWTVADFDELRSGLRRLDRFSDEHGDMALSLFSGAHRITSDKEGRIMLPEDLVAHADLGGEIVFMGAGDTFQIWEPEAAQRRQREAIERARTLRLTLPSGGAA
jgi:MraZ protein